MRTLVPAAFELRVAGGATLVAGALAAVASAPADPRAAGLGLVGAVVLLWAVWGARALRRAVRLALPVPPQWGIDGAGATAARVLVVRVAPLCALAVAAPLPAGDGRAGVIAAAAAGVLGGTGLATLVAAARIGRGDRRRGRRLLRRPGRVDPLDRRAFHLEPQALAAGPGGRTSGPWPSHRPPARAPGTALELDPSNPAAVHPVGVRDPRRAAPPPV
jgi:hypothetical protein